MGIKGESSHPSTRHRACTDPPARWLRAGLTALINDNAPKAIKQAEMKTLFGRKVAIDACVASTHRQRGEHKVKLTPPRPLACVSRRSMSIYQFLIAVRQQDGQQLMNDAGETTSHLMGLFYRSVAPSSSSPGLQGQLGSS